jgi:hypothetical protein
MLCICWIKTTGNTGKHNIDFLKICSLCRLPSEKGIDCKCDGGVQRRIRGPQKDGIIGGWRKLHNEEAHKLTLHQIYLKRSSKGGCNGRGK